MVVHAWVMRSCRHPHRRSWLAGTSKSARKRAKERHIPVRIINPGAGLGPGPAASARAAEAFPSLTHSRSTPALHARPPSPGDPDPGPSATPPRLASPAPARPRAGMAPDSQEVRAPPPGAALQQRPPAAAAAGPPPRGADAFPALGGAGAPPAPPPQWRAAAPARAAPAPAAAASADLRPEHFPTLRGLVARRQQPPAAAADGGAASADAGSAPERPVSTAGGVSDSAKAANKARRGLAPVSAPGHRL